ncbi:uncharacterized protein LOC114305746 [Camellia sinensis]|uniref:uncharacterized protein LOC114305746 n=1 Tax=Camellia sinensis TaxID=4442 RepID=UPI0010357CEC|nr:uncharacterized protein LOC114305746 [Camellia sinensis]
MGMEIGANRIVVSHLQFVDDSLLFCEANRQETLNIKRIHRWFEILLGLKINYHKSVVCGVGISEASSKEFTTLLNCTTQGFALKYLGLSLGVSPSRKNIWKPVVDKIKAKLSGWKSRFLSFASRLTLIKAVLSNLPVYYLSLFKMLEGIAKEIDSIQAAFL